MTYLVNYLAYDVGDYSLILDFKVNQQRPYLTVVKFRPSSRWVGQLLLLISQWRTGRRQRAYLSSVEYQPQLKLLSVGISRALYSVGQVTLTGYQTTYVARRLLNEVKFQAEFLGFRVSAKTNRNYTRRWSILSQRQWLSLN